MAIHSTAIVDPKAELHESVEVGPYAIIEGGVRIGAGTRVMAHAYINGETTIGEDNAIHMGAIIGHEPQHAAYDGAPRRTLIGDRNVIREYMTINGSFEDEGTTTVGDDCFLMTSSHIGHDCHVGNKIILANGALVGGHSTIEDGVFLSGNVAVHQFVRIGRPVMIQGGAGVSQDVPPFMIVRSVNAVAGLNVIGMRRAGVTAEARRDIKAAFKIMYRGGNSVTRAVEILKAGGYGAEVGEIVAFIESSKRGVCWRQGGVNAW